MEAASLLVWRSPRWDITILGNPSFSQLLGSPVLFLAFGLGSGLAPRAPGTVGTLVAVPIWYAASYLPFITYLCLLYAAVVAGTYICGRASAQLGVHDHSGIVWDEWVGFWIAMAAVTPSWLSLLLGFSLFRIFDILKPWPISWIDKNIDGGIGIMLDDILAGLMTAALLAILKSYGLL